MSLLRWAAVAIALVAAVDPSVSLGVHERPRIAVLMEDGGRISDLDRGSFRDFDFVYGPDPSAAAIVAVGARYPAQPIPESARVATISSGGPAGSIRSLTAPRSVPPGSTIHLEVELAGSRGRTATLTASIGRAVLVHESHTWVDEGRWRASLDVPPVGEPPYLIDIGIDGDRGLTTACAVVDLSDRLPVLFYDARPSWTTAFVKRALEGDPRFDVSSLDVASRGIAVRTPLAPQSVRSTDLSRFRTVIVGGLDTVTPDDAAVLNRFMVDAGGSVAVLPDARADTAAVRALVPGSFGGETLLDRPAALTTDPPLPRIDASELLTTAPVGAHAMARTNDLPVVWTLPRGEGRLLVSGAMDAWRFRTASGVEFDRFWQSAIAGLALAVRSALAIDVVGPVEGTHPSRIHVRMRDVDESQPVSMSATLASGEPVRLWPDSDRGSFSGDLLPARPGANRVDVVATNGGRTERAWMRFVPGARARVSDSQLPLSALSQSHGGIDVVSGNLAPLDRWLHETVRAKTVPVEHHPMRSPWWIVPFAGCLSIEWWARRRRGLR